MCVCARARVRACVRACVCIPQCARAYEESTLHPLRQALIREHSPSSLLHGAQHPSHHVAITRAGATLLPTSPARAPSARRRIGARRAMHGCHARVQQVQEAREVQQVCSLVLEVPAPPRRHPAHSFMADPLTLAGPAPVFGPECARISTRGCNRGVSCSAQPKASSSQKPRRLRRAPENHRRARAENPRQTKGRRTACGGGIAHRLATRCTRRAGTSR